MVISECLLAEPIITAPVAVVIDIVICTYNRAMHLDEVLYALSAQRVERGVTWSVLVVDNGSTDSTEEVVEAHRLRQLLPGLRRVTENQQGLHACSAARRIGNQSALDCLRR